MIKFHPVISLLTLALSLLIATKSLADEYQQPNILWIMAEDMSPDLGCYGNNVVTTPHIDGLAAKGMKFTNVFTTAPACSPSRTSLATGVYQTTLGAHHMRYTQALKPKLPEPVKHLPELMRELGFYTGNIRTMGGIGKDDWQFKLAGKPWDTHSWKKVIKQQPFFAQINSKHSHRAFPPQQNISKDKIKIPPYYPDHPVMRNDWAGYLTSVNTFDQQVGAVLKQLEIDGLHKNTIVCVLSDHGRPMMRGKTWLYDSGTHIPLIIYIPEDLKKPQSYQPGTEKNDLISSIDLVAETILMAGGSLPDWIQAKSFLQKGSQPREYIYTAVDRIGNLDKCSRAIRSKKYKYIRNFKTPGSINECSTPARRAVNPIYHLLNIMGEKNLLTPVQAQLLKPMEEEELYDIKNDPYETINLIGKEKFNLVHQELRINLENWIKTSEDKGMKDDSEAIKKRFIQYGVSSFQKKEKRIQELRASVEKHFE